MPKLLSLILTGALSVTLLSGVGVTSSANAAPAASTAVIPTNYPTPAMPECEARLIGNDCSKRDTWYNMLRIMNTGEATGNREGAVRLLLSTLIGDRIVGVNSDKVDRTNDKEAQYLFDETISSLAVSGRESLRCYATNLIKDAIATDSVFDSISLFNKVVEVADNASKLSDLVEASESDANAVKYLVKNGVQEATDTEIPTSMTDIYIGMAKAAGAYMEVKAFPETLKGTLETLLSCTSVYEFPAAPAPAPVKVHYVTKTYTKTLSAKVLLAAHEALGQGTGKNFKQVHYIKGVGGCYLTSHKKVLTCEGYNKAYMDKQPDSGAALRISPGLTVPKSILKAAYKRSVSMQATVYFTKVKGSVQWSYGNYTSASTQVRGVKKSPGAQTLKAMKLDTTPSWGTGAVYAPLDISVPYYHKVSIAKVKVRFIYKVKQG